MVLLSGEVETTMDSLTETQWNEVFRMVLLSGEVETPCWEAQDPRCCEFRMVLLSGEVETPGFGACPSTAPPVPDGFAIRGS